MELSESAKLTLSSLKHIGEMDQVKKASRFYLRYYLTIRRARQLNEKMYGDKLDKSNTQKLTKHPLRVASHTQAIKNQSISDYHMTWLVGVLHDAKEDNLYIYLDEIQNVLVDLLPAEKERVKMYIDQLTSDESLSKGQKKANQLKKMNDLDLIPCWIRIFDKYDNCRRFKANPVGNDKQKLEGYFAIAYLCYKKACQRYDEINKNLEPKIHEFYQKLLIEIGGIEKIEKAAKKYIEAYS